MVVAVLAVVAALAWGLRALVPDAPLLELELDGRVVFVPFVNGTGDSELDWVEHGLMPMAAEALAQTPGVSVVPPERLQKLTTVRELDPGIEGTAPRIRELAFALGGEVVVEATVVRPGGAQGTRPTTLPPLTGDVPRALALDVAIHRPGREPERGTLSAADPVTLANLLVVSLARGLDSSGEPVRLERVYSSSTFLTQLHGMGLHVETTGGAAEALPYFEMVVAHRPYFLAAKLALARCARRTGDLDRADEETREVLEEAQARGDRRLQAEALVEQARQSAIAGNQDAAAELLAQAGALQVQIGDDARRSSILFELVRLTLARNDRDTARQLLEDRLTLQRRLGDQPGQIDSLIELATLELGEIGRLPRVTAAAAGSDTLPTTTVEGEVDPETTPEPGSAAAAHLDEAMRVAEAIDDLWLRMQVVASQGELAHRRGETDEAVARWSEALGFYRQQSDVPRQLLLNSKLTHVHLQARNYDAAEESLHESLEMARTADQPALEASASLRLAWLLLRTGYPRQARPHIDRALELDRWIVEDRLALQLVIAWLAYEQGNFRLALDTQLEAKRQAGQRWRPLDEAFLRTFRRALTEGRRLPVPGEETPAARPS